MNTALLLGVIFGTGVVTIASALAPARTPLPIALDRLHNPDPDPEPNGGQASRWTQIVGIPLARSPIGVALQHRLSSELRVAEANLHDVVSTMALTFIVGVMWAPAVATLMMLGGVSVGWIIPAWASLAFGALGALVPILALRSTAARRRQAFRHALSCFLDLVSVRLAGGAGVDGALNHSADAGQGWAFGEIRQALAEARLLGEPPWSSLARLGETLGINELGELAASTALAGGEGARVRASLSAKARSIRTRGLAAAEADAQSASERMSLPIVLLMLGFVAFLGYPAVMQVFTNL